MSEDAPPPATALQFDKAEYPVSQTAASICAACKRPLTPSYYTANKAIICDRCHSQFRAFLAGGSRFKRALAATALGVLAGLAGAALWYAVRKITGYEIGIIAIAVGLMVGVAVRKGSKGRGGWFYQTLAIVLTYTSVGAQYVPDLVEGLMKESRQRHAASAGPAENPAASDAHGKPSAKNAANERPAPNDPAVPKPGVVKLTPAVALFLVIALIMSLALPILVGLHSPISLLIVGIALYEAWKINKGSAIRVAGPFQLAPAAAPGAPGA